MPDETPFELLRGLAVMAEPPDPSAVLVAKALGLPGVPTAADYSDVFLFQLYPYASVHLGPEGMMGGDARERIGGFWRALGLTPPAEPDHLAALLGLYASLAEREQAEADPAERALLRAGRLALMDEHLTPWVFGFLARVEELASAPYARWARLLSEVLEAELAARNDTPPLSAHLRDAPVLPDPRLEGGEDFLAGILAPVRCGAILTRADLAAVATRVGLGLRAGERRYALESLLAQDAANVLRGLSDEVSRQGRGHEDRAAVLGPSSAVLAKRAAEATRLLSALADEAERAAEAPETVGRAGAECTRTEVGAS